MLPLPSTLHVLPLFTRPYADKRQTQQGFLSLLVRYRVYFPCWCAKGSSFPADVQKCLLSLLKLYRIIIPCWFFTWSSFPAGILQSSYFKILPWQTNKMATGHKTHGLGRQSSNDHNCQIWFTFLHASWKKCNFIIFPLWDLSVVIATKQQGQNFDCN